MELTYISDKYYVYKHFIVDENNNEDVFYIGKGKGDRVYSQNRNSLWEKIVNENNGRYNVEILRYFKNEKDALKYEIYLQHEYLKNGQCKGCADKRNIFGKFRNVYENKDIQISIDILDKWVFKEDIESIINEYELKDDKCRIMTVNKFRTYIISFGYIISSKRYTMNGIKTTMYKIEKQTP